MDRSWAATESTRASEAACQGDDEGCGGAAGAAKRARKADSWRWALARRNAVARG
jgi:hypothetical protein